MNSKKTYCKPRIESYQIDREISLAMQSESNDPPPPPAMARPSDKLQKDPFNGNPFGTSKKK